MRYTLTENELISIVETLKNFYTILLVQDIKIYTDHKNLTRKNFNTNNLLLWRLIPEKYIPYIEYIPGAKIYQQTHYQYDLTTEIKRLHMSQGIQR